MRFRHALFWRDLLGTVVFALLMTREKATRWVSFGTSFLLLSGILVSVALGPMFLAGPEAALQYRWLLELKRNLTLDFLRSAWASVPQWIGRNPVVFLLAAAVPFVAKGRSRNVAAACAFAVAALFLFRCFRVEPYNHAYLCHFWAVTSIGAAWSARALRNRFPVFGLGVAALALALGPNTSHAKWYEAFAFDHVSRNRAIDAMYEKVPRGAKAIAFAHPYMLLRERDEHLAVMAHHSAWDIGAFDYVLAPPEPEILAAKDQWFDALTVERGRQLEEGFEIRAEVADVRYKPPWWPGRYIPGMAGYALYAKPGE